MVSNKIKKVCFFFDSRATFSYSNNIIEIFKKRKKKYDIIVSGNYLDKKFGISEDIFKKKNLKINYKVKFLSPKHQLSSWPISMGKAIINYAKALEKIKPDILIITGDRIETLAICITASYMDIRIAHIQAGDKSGHIDDVARSAIAKFSHLHFAPSKQASERLIAWGENKKRIFFTGAPQLNFLNLKKENSNKIQDYYLIIFHPVFNEKEKIKVQIQNLINAVKDLNLKAYWVYSNNDMGHNIIINSLKKIKSKKIKIIKNLDREKFIEIMKNSKGLIGNSSCGIIEASMFKIPVINIGSRQNGRPQSKNILNSGYSENEIKKKILFMKKNFINLTKNIKNPYYNKKASEKIYKLIFNYKKKDKIFNKY